MSSEPVAESLVGDQQAEQENAAAEKQQVEHEALRRRDIIQSPSPIGFRAGRQGFAIGNP
jgi:hypothetical protein